MNERKIMMCRLCPLEIGETDSGIVKLLILKTVKQEFTSP